MKWGNYETRGHRQCAVWEIGAFFPAALSHWGFWGMQQHVDVRVYLSCLLDYAHKGMASWHTHISTHLSSHSFIKSLVKVISVKWDDSGLSWVCICQPQEDLKWSIKVFKSQNYCINICMLRKNLPIFSIIFV